MDGLGNCDPLCSVDDISSQDFEAIYQPKTDLLKALAILASALAGVVAINHSWVAANQVKKCSFFWVFFFGDFILGKMMVLEK